MERLTRPPEGAPVEPPHSMDTRYTTLCVWHPLPSGHHLPSLRAPSLYPLGSPQPLPQCPHRLRVPYPPFPATVAVCGPRTAPSQGYADWGASLCAISRARSAASCGQINSTARHGLGNSTGSSACVLDTLESATAAEAKLCLRAATWAGRGCQLNQPQEAGAAICGASTGPRSACRSAMCAASARRSITLGPLA